MKQDKFSNMTRKVEQWLNLISQRRPCLHHTTGRAADIWIQNKSLNKNKNSEVAGHNCLSSKGDTRPVCGVQNWCITMNGIYFCPKPLTPLYSLQSSRGKITLNGSCILYFHNTSTPPFVQRHWYITTGTPISSTPPLVHDYLVDQWFPNFCKPLHPYTLLFSP